MRIEEMLDRIRLNGASLELDGADLYVRCTGTPATDLVELLRTHKPALLAELTRVRIDFETASELDLRKVGASAYAEHPSTRILLLCYCIGAGPVQVWREGDPIPPDLLASIAGGSTVAAHNISFEHAIWHAQLVPIGWPALPWERWSCTSIRARVMRLPASLEGAGAALRLPVRKDAAGKRLMKKLARTAFRGGYEPTEGEITQLMCYCGTDVEVLRALDRQLPELDPDTSAIAEVDFVMNRRGVPVDVPLVRQLIKVRDAENRRLVAAMQAITAGAISKPTQILRIDNLLREHGIALDSHDRETLEKWIDEHPDADDLPAQVIRFRLGFSHASDAKLTRILDEAATSGLVRDGFFFHGAHTGRWSGKGAQLQNIPRAQLSDTEATLRRLAAAADSDDPAQVPDDGSSDASLSVKAQIAGSLRGVFLAPEGEVFVCADLSQVESRVLAWIGDQHDKLAAYARGDDVYTLVAGSIGSTDRNFGKLADLSFGFGSGARTMILKAPIYGLTIDLAAAEKATNDWRAANPDIVRFWYALRDAVDAVVDQPPGGPPVPVGTIGLSVRRTAGAVRVRLPSGRDLIYRAPYYEIDEEHDDRLVLVAMQPKGDALVPTKLWHGLLTENVVQAVARDILSEAMLTLHREGVRIVATIHDEIVALATEQEADAIRHRMVEVLSTPPIWASGLPLAAEGYVNRRFLKPKRLPAHAPLAPSVASRWMHCPGSVAAEKAVPTPPVSGFAAEGTEAHRIFAQSLEQGVAPAVLTDDLALAAPLAVAVEHARSCIAGRAVLLEHRLPPLPDLPQVWGTADCLAFDQDRVNGVLDLKFGTGVVVEADTLQLGIYALLAARHFGIATTGITATILQPRIGHQDGPVRSYHYTPEELEQLEQTIRAAVVATEQPDAPRHAGEWCRFCNAAGTCPEFQRASHVVPPIPSIWRRPALRGAAASQPDSVNPLPGDPHDLSWAEQVP
jgi:DNA polymerase bacteriophage-type